MTRHRIDPHCPVMGQLRTMGMPEHLPIDLAMVYRFVGRAGDLLYVGVTVSPRGRWQAHKNTAQWWHLVSEVLVEWHPHERAALDSEVAAIRSEHPRFNRRSSRAIHESRVSAA